MSLAAGIDINDGIDRALRWFRRKRAQKVPCKRYLAHVASDYRMHGLARQSEQEILERLRAQGRILKDDKGHCYVITTAAV